MNEWNGFRRIKKSRKEHACVCCQQKIPVSSPYLRFVGEWKNEFQDWCLCDFCEDYYNHFKLDWSDGVTCMQDELQDDSLFGYKCPKCGGKKVDFEFRTYDDEITFNCDMCEYEETMSLRKACGISQPKPLDNSPAQMLH